MLFIESRTELGYAPKENTYLSAYSLESLRDIADKINENVEEVGDGYYLYNSLTKLYDMIYSGYPATEEEYKRFAEDKSKKDCFAILYGCRLAHCRCACGIDGLAKTPLQASIFASWYNIRKKDCCAILYGCRLAHRRCACGVDGLAKTPCKQAFLLRGK